jgi:hypothetical protein
MYITRSKLKEIIKTIINEAKGDMARANLGRNKLAGIDLKREYNRLVGPKGQAALHKELLFTHWGTAADIDSLCEYHLSLGSRKNNSEISTGIQPKKAPVLQTGNPYETSGVAGVILDGFVTLASNSDLHTGHGRGFGEIKDDESYQSVMKKTSGSAKRPHVGKVLSQSEVEPEKDDFSDIPMSIDIFESVMSGNVGQLSQVEKDKIRNVLITHPSEYDPNKGLMGAEALLDNFTIAGICVFKKDSSRIASQNKNIALMSLKVPVIDESKNINLEFYETALSYHFESDKRLLEQRLAKFNEIVQRKFK